MIDIDVVGNLLVANIVGANGERLGLRTVTQATKGKFLQASQPVPVSSTVLRPAQLININSPSLSKGPNDRV